MKENTKRTDDTGTHINRRDVMKAVGGAAAIGSIGTVGTVGATGSSVCTSGDEQNDVKCFTSEDLKGLSDCTCKKIDSPTDGGTFSFGTAEVKVASDGKSVEIVKSGDLCLFAVKCGRGAAPEACTVVKCPKDGDVVNCKEGSVSNIQGIYGCKECSCDDGGNGEKCNPELGVKFDCGTAVIDASKLENCDPITATAYFDCDGTVKTKSESISSGTTTIKLSGDDLADCVPTKVEFTGGYAATVTNDDASKFICEECPDGTYAKWECSGGKLVAAEGDTGDFYVSGDCDSFTICADFDFKAGVQAGRGAELDYFEGAKRESPTEQYCVKITKSEYGGERGHDLSHVSVVCPDGTFPEKGRGKPKDRK